MSPEGRFDDELLLRLSRATDQGSSGVRSKGDRARPFVDSGHLRQGRGDGGRKPLASLNKISEVYDRIAFAGVGRYNEFDRLREAGIRWADSTGFTYSREDVDARALANYYAQHLGDMFTEGQKPLEVEILVAQLGNALRPTKLYRVAYEGTISDEQHFAVLGGDAETIRDRFALTEESIESLATTLKNAATALAGPDRVLPAEELEVCILEDRGVRRTFLRLTDEQIKEMLS